MQPRPPTAPTQRINPAAQLAVAGHVCVRHKGGGVSCWGWNEHGQVGDGGTANVTSPVRVPDLTAVELTAGRSHTCARKASGEVLCWGMNTLRQVGVSEGTQYSRPVPVTMLGAVAGEVAN